MAETHNDCIIKLKDVQDYEYDIREQVREADTFINERNGQWESNIYSRFDGRPRYTFDETNPIINDVMGTYDNNDLDIKVVATGSESSRETAEVYEGMIRNIENISFAQSIYRDAIKVMIGTGFSAWRVDHDYRDEDTFQQDLLIRPIFDPKNHVWLDSNHKLQSGADSEYGWIFTAYTKEQYEKFWPKGSCTSMPIHEEFNYYTYNEGPDIVVVGEYFYKKYKKRKLALMSNGMVVVMDDDFERVLDELATERGVTLVSERDRDYPIVMHQFMDGDDWLSDAKETVFSYIPIIPLYGNYHVSNNKRFYWGVTEKLMDAQRVLNYSGSREVEEGALAPRDKVWMTKDQAESAEVKKTLRTINTNNDPIQLYDFQENHPAPMVVSFAQPAQRFIDTKQGAKDFIDRTSGTYDAARGEAPSGRSGEAIELLQFRSDAPKGHWFKSAEIALQHTYEILNKAIPKVYVDKQSVNLILQDGTNKEAVIYDTVLDRDSGKEVKVLDLAKGVYSVSCSFGPSMKSRREKTFDTITGMAQVDESIMQIGGDVLLNSVSAPGMDDIAFRKRRQMLQAGLIPQEQMTDEEKQFMVQQSQNNQNNMSNIDKANLMIAEAEMKKAEGKNQETLLKIQLEEQKLRLKEFELKFKQQETEVRTSMQASAEMAKLIKMQAETLKTIKDAMGADAVVSDTVVQAFTEQANDLVKSLKVN